MGKKMSQKTLQESAYALQIALIDLLKESGIYGFVVNICIFLTKLLQKTQKTEKYTCAMCKGVFYKSTPEDEALAELKEFFGDISVKDCEVVCDDCWEKIRPDKHGFSLPVLENDLLAEPIIISEIITEEARRRFIEEWKAQWKGLQKAEEQKILYGDSSAIEPVGILSFKKDK